MKAFRAEAFWRGVSFLKAVRNAGVVLKMYLRGIELAQRLVQINQLATFCLNNALAQGIGNICLCELTQLLPQPKPFLLRERFDLVQKFARTHS